MALTYEVSGYAVAITGMTTDPSDGKLVIPSEIEGKTVTTIGKNAFDSKTTITSVEFPASVGIISEEAFCGCSKLSQVSFTEDSQLTTIQDKAFYKTDITEFTIPENVAYIGNDAFSSYWLSAVTVLSKTPCDANYPFGPKYAPDFKIIVPAGTLEAYKAAYGWSDYADFIQEAAPTSINHTTTSASTTSAAIYTLDGRLASKDGNTQALAKGIYMQNGKKVVIGK